MQSDMFAGADITNQESGLLRAPVHAGIDLSPAAVRGFQSN